MKRITVEQKHIQRAKKRDWMQSHKADMAQKLEAGKYAIPMLTTLTLDYKGGYKWTKNYEND